MTDILHDDELAIDRDLVRRLVDRDLPEHAELPLSRLGASGSSNALFRLGDDLLVRMPRQPGGSGSINLERRWSPLMAANLPVEVPEILAVGEPGFGYPEHWSVVRWIDGRHPDVVGPDHAADESRTQFAGDFADVLLALRETEVPADAYADPALRNYRGLPLITRAEATRRDIEACRRIDGLDLDLDAALRFWEQAMRLPGVADETPPRWYHCDLLAENLLVRDGRLTAVLDFGGLAIGDPAIDLHGVWELFDEPSREIVRERAGIDEAEWQRGRAWALSIAVMTFPYYWHTMPQRCASRLAMARNALA
ncbi:aminoglycoside phosphotransferase family protein [Microlunatus elymi]|uniref:aminoglycoside phosphotransferase family protein n=1 Tax=Microlunatus elymi TaxID=2596828 RepID=UPI00143DB74A|nr:aminoglycoside phosphotransferase family protein [Microlunatus elymi]